MNKSIMNWLLIIILILTSFSADLEAKRKSKPWSDIKLSTLPSVIGFSNSWLFEINQRSPAYLSDLDKLYASFAYGWGGHDNNITPRTPSAIHYGYDIFNGLDYKIQDFKINIYSKMAAKTYGSVWIDYGKSRDRITDNSIIESVPIRLDVKAAFAWEFASKWTAAVSGKFNNWPRSQVFVVQPNTSIEQLTTFAHVGDNLSGEIDLMYRPSPDLDIIFGSYFQSTYTKFTAPNPLDSVEIKEYIYSTAPKLIVKKTFSKGDYLRAGGLYYFNLFDYQYLGGTKYRMPSLAIPSFHPQSIEVFTPNWRFFVDGTKMLGENSSLYAGIDLENFPNTLTSQETDFVPIQFSRVALTNLFSTKLNLELTSKLTRIFNAVAGVELRYFDNGSNLNDLDDQSIYAAIHLGGTTRFHHNLWFSVRLPDIRLYSPEAFGSSVLFEKRTYLEFEIIFLGL